MNKKSILINENTELHIYDDILVIKIRLYEKYMLNTNNKKNTIWKNTTTIYQHKIFTNKPNNRHLHGNVNSERIFHNFNT